MGAQQSRQMLEAASTGNVQQMSQLLTAVPVDSTDDDGWTALHFSSWAGRAAVVRELLSHDADIRTKDKRGRMPIHLAALRGQTDVIALLCDHGTPLSDVDADGTAPLHKALGQGHMEAAQQLLAYGADAMQSLQDGTTPLHLAAYSGNADAVRLLISNSASVNAKNCDGQTPLFEAAAAGHTEAAKLLLQYGADAEHRDAEGLIAADLAPPQLSALLRQPVSMGQSPRAGGQVPSQQQASQPKGQSAQQAGFKSRLWSSCPSSGLPSSSASSPGARHKQALEHSNRPPSALVRPQDVEGDRHHSGPARVQMESLPSAPPLPESHAHALHAASSCYSLACGSAQHVQYPCLHASPRIENSMRAGLSQSRQGQQEDQTNVAQDTVGQTAGGSVGAGDLDPGQGGDSAGAGPAVQPAGGLAWAMQTAAGASSAAVSALSAWLPWHHDSSTAKSTVQEQQPELQAQAVPQTVPSCRRYGLQPGDDSDDDEARGDQSAVEQLASNLQGLAVSGIEALAYRLFRHEELYEATNGFNEATNRLDRAGSPNSAFLGVLPAASLDAAYHSDGMQVVVRGHTHLHAGQLRLDESAAVALADVKHPNILPLIGVCVTSGHVVYSLMENGSLDDALHSRRPKLAAAPVRLDWISRTRIAAETASALVHLHSMQSSAFAHGSLRPSCILLDRDCSARIGDAAVGAVFSQAQVSDQAADVFALGVIMLQLLTGSEPHGLAQHAAGLLQAEGVASLVDPCAGDWPQEAALDFCSLAVRCSAWHANERPSLSSEVLPALSRLVGRAEGAAAAASSKAARAHDAEPPASLLCPITQELFENPVVCADGYTYNRTAIARWLQSGHSTSPMTNLPLSSRELRPNYTLRSAAMEWQEARESQTH